MPGLYIIKLGGSVITEKEGTKFEAREKAIERIAFEIKRAVDEKGFSLVVVHGAGPFGHSNVKDFGINEGVFNERQREGYEKTVKDCNFLNSVVVKKFNEAGLEAIGLDANKLVVQEEKKIVEFDLGEIEKALEEGKVPVLFGQMVPDKRLNFSVVSGDAIIGFLARELNAGKVFLGTDVAGIFTADPKKDATAERVPVIDEGNFEQVLEKVGEAGTVDVTKGMKGKLEKLGKMLKGTTALIFDAGKEESVYRTLVGEEVEGTEVRL